MRRLFEVFLCITWFGYIFKPDAFPVATSVVFYDVQRIQWVTPKQVERLEVPEVMVRWALGVTTKDIRYIRGTAKITRIWEKLKQKRLKWFGHIKRRKEYYLGKNGSASTEKRRKACRRWMDVMRDDMRNMGVIKIMWWTDHIGEKTALWRPRIREQPKEDHCY